MFVILLRLLTMIQLADLVTGDQQLVCLESIRASEGENVTLRCHSHPKLHLDEQTVEVSRDDLPGRDNIVHLYRGRKDDFENQMTRYRDRTSLDPEDLTSGNVTLRICSVNESDSGRFVVFIPKLHIRFVINVTIKAKDPKIQTKSRDPTNVPPTSDDPGAEKKTDVRIIVGSVLGVLVVVVVVVGFVLLRKYKVVDIWRNFRGRRPNNDEPGTRQMEQGEDSELIVNNDNSSGKSSNKIY
uniref:myelin-oligodendrocyte glycoprotein-like isoform X2 n=1 Tax=Gasterosteus aculeatus aculeatus TaxID=481459 RepID=UPI001A9A2016|nr:myelin-oligodendrocyte glycoprotein-like isoform X2 [Gasterosteus aculeatus aculeatus]